jgi:tetratricopeptide (TPR) repeat protein
MAAHLALQRGALADAVAHAQALLQRDPKHRMSHLMLARIFTTWQRHEDAIRHYTALLELDPGQKRIRLTLARLYGQMKQIAKSEEVLQPLLQDEDLNWRAHVVLGNIHAGQNDMETALRSFREAARLAPDEIEPVLAVGTVLQSLNRNSEAEALYLAQLKRHPDNPLIKRRITQLKENRDGAAVVAEFQMALRQAPEGVQTSLVTAMLLLGQDAFTEALKELRLAEAAQPDNPAVRFYLGVALEAVQQPDEARQEYSRIPESAPFFTKAQIRLALLEATAKQFSAAIERLDKLSAREPQRTDILLNLTAVLLQDNAFDRVIEMTTRGLVLDPEQTRFLYLRAMAHDKLKRWPDAEQDLRRYLERNPDDPQALNYLGYSWADRQENLTEALQLLERAVKLAPGDGYIADSLAWALFRLNRPQEALPYMLEAARLQPEDATIAEHLGDVLQAIGRREEALSTWKKALELDQDNQKLREKILHESR